MLNLREHINARANIENDMSITLSNDNLQMAYRKETYESAKYISSNTL